MTGIHDINLIEKNVLTNILNSLTQEPQQCDRWLFIGKSKHKLFFLADSGNLLDQLLVGIFEVINWLVGRFKQLSVMPRLSNPVVVNCGYRRKDG